MLMLAIKRFKKILSNFKFDLLLAQCGNYGIFRSEQAAILAGNKLGVPIKSIVIHHACITPPLFMGIVFRVIDYFLVKSLTSLITVSNATMLTVLNNSNLLNKGSLKNKVIYNGVPKNNFIKKNYLNLQQSNTSSLNLKIGMVSRLSHEKGHEDLIRAFYTLPPEYKKKMDIYLIGEDERGQKKKLKQLVINLKLENKINFLDYVDLDSKKIILSLDLFVSVTKKFEGFGLSIAEAMSVGVPVLASNVGAVKEFFNNDCGKLINPENIEDIKNSLIDFYDNKKTWDKKAEIAKNRIEKIFSAENMGKKYMDYFDSELKK
jgi:glycosyltransferase involved in cell wall biosynthesis